MRGDDDGLLRGTKEEEELEPDETGLEVVMELDGSG